MVARQLVAQLKDDNVETYSMPYMKDEIVTMLNSLNQPWQKKKNLKIDFLGVFPEIMHLIHANENITILIMEVGVVGIKMRMNSVKNCIY